MNVICISNYLSRFYFKATPLYTFTFYFSLPKSVISEVKKGGGEGENLVKQLGLS